MLRNPQMNISVGYWKDMEASRPGCAALHPCSEGIPETVLNSCTRSSRQA